MRELTRHLDHVDLAVSGQAQMFDQPFGIDHLAAADDTREVGIKRSVAQSHAGRNEGRDDDVRRAGGDLPQRSRAGFLDFRVRRLIFEGQHVVGGQAYD